MVLMNPSAILAASLIAFSPKPDMNTGGGRSGTEYSRAVSTM
jgi:hypothetical protein